MNGPLRYLFFLLVVRPVMLVVLGLNVRGREWLPRSGPAIIVANHNSHLDVFAIMALFGMRRLHLLRPVAAADYFMVRPLRRWFATRIVGIIPIDRDNVRKKDEAGKPVHPLAPISEALEAGSIVLLFPEGTRGEPEKFEAFKTGIAHLAKRHPEIPIVPLFMHGLGKALPRGEALLVPFFCDVFIGQPLDGSLSKSQFMQALNDEVQSLASKAKVSNWT